MSIRIGICGTGSFSACFIPLFKAHPLVEEVVLCDIDASRLKEAMDARQIVRGFRSLDELCRSDVDAVAIFTNRWKHGPQAVQCLKAGKHVYSAVPAATTMDETTELVETVRKTGLLYMTGETSYYYPCAIYCRDRFHKGDFGRFVYGEGEYYHEFDHGFYQVFQREGPGWERHAGFPPMLYPTHSVSMILSVTGAHVTHVSCMGYEDKHSDGLFHEDVNEWRNVFSNETALCRTSDGGMCRINEFRRVGIPSRVSMSMYGTEGSYEEHTGSQKWCNKDPKATLDVTDMLTCRKIPVPAEQKENLGATLADDFYKGASAVHELDRLPSEFIGLSNGHFGSHQFLVDDFVRALANDELPPNNVWASARYCLPGIIAHESAKCGGELMAVPDFGDPPREVACY